MNSSALAEWALFFFGVLSAVIVAFVGKNVPKLFKGKSIQDVVDSANSIIQLYEQHVGALELKVDALKKQVADLSAKLDESLAKNEALQKLLLISPAVNVPEVPSEPVQK